MNQQTRARSLAALLALVLIFAVNTVMAGILDKYSEWFAWTIFALTVLLVVVVLRFQQQFSLGRTLAVLTIPLALCIVGAVIGV